MSQIDISSIVIVVALFGLPVWAVILLWRARRKRRGFTISERWPAYYNEKDGTDEWNANNPKW